MNYLVIYPGRFHPFHLGHKASYDYLTKKYGENSVYIATSAVQDPETSPFAYAMSAQLELVEAALPLVI
jgi:nicotinamide mononucleotide adenylyltransferase